MITHRNPKDRIALTFPGRGKSKLIKGFLYLEGRRLTSERLREAIEIACLSSGSILAAGGGQACDPHWAGSGRILKIATFKRPGAVFSRTRWLHRGRGCGQE